MALITPQPLAAQPHQPPPPPPNNDGPVSSATATALEAAAGSLQAGPHTGSGRGEAQRGDRAVAAAAVAAAAAAAAAAKEKERPSKEGQRMDSVGNTVSSNANTYIEDTNEGNGIIKTGIMGVARGKGQGGHELGANGQRHQQHQHQHQHHHAHNNSNHLQKGQELAAAHTNAESDAAKCIQRYYRGHRSRRALRGMGLSADARWSEAVKEAKYRNATKPTSRQHRRSISQASANSAARQNWKRVGEIARRAGADNPPDNSEDDAQLSDSSEDYVVAGQVRHLHPTGLPASKQYRDERTQKLATAKRAREKTAKMMDLQYFLEMVDTKHRYGSNLRTYHAEWKKADTHENFFYWLDEGSGRNIEMPTVSREKLDSERVRYLSREERQNYLVKIDNEGRLCWAKNGERITTSTDWEDTIKDGIVSKHDGHGSSRPVSKHSLAAGYSSWDSDSSSDAESTASYGTGPGSDSSEAARYVNEDFKEAKGLKKLKKVSAATVLNHLLRKSVKPNTWIFVADTSFRLYVGIKHSGQFQHSSFLHGSRISAAGTLKIKDGQLRSLSPLSGHYRPPTANFRAFEHSLRDADVDMSRVSISKSYAVLVGLEVYVRARRKIKHGIQHTHSAKEKVVHPDEAAERKERERDKSESAKKEQMALERQRMEEGEERYGRWRKRWSRGSGGTTTTTAAAADGRNHGSGGHGSRLGQKVMRWLGGTGGSGSGSGSASGRGTATADSKKHKLVQSKPGQDVESGIAPEGKR